MELNPVSIYPPDEPTAVGLPTGDNNDGDTAVSLPVAGVNDQPLPPRIAKQRADKAAQGVGPIIQKSPDELYQDFLDGQEAAVRDLAARSQDHEAAIARQQKIQQMAVSKGGPLDAEEVSRVLDPFNPANGAADPDTVLEKAYSTNYVSSLNTAATFMSDSNPLVVGQSSIPEATQQTLDEGSELLTKNQYVLKKMQDMDTLVQNQSLIGRAVDEGLQMFQPYDEYKERGLAGNTSITAGLGLGSNIDEQHYNLWKMPLPEFKKNFDAAMEYLSSNPSLARDYASKMLSQDTFGTALGNTFTAMALPDAKLGLGVLKKVVTFNQVRKAAKDIVESAAINPEATRATMAEGAGASGEAAVQRVTQDVVHAIDGTLNPSMVSHDTLMSTWQTMANDFSANTGTYLSREDYTRLHDGMAKPGEDLLGRINTMARVERTPVAVTSENVIREYKDKIANDYKGPPGTLADTEGPYRESDSGTYWYKSRIVNYDGEQFADEATARGFAEQNGHADPEIIGTPSEKLYLPEAAAKKIESVTQKSGRTQFFIDGGVEVIPSSKPQSGFVPYNQTTGKFEKTLTTESAQLEQQGLGFHIVRWTPMKESDNLIRDLMIKTTGGQVIPEATSTSSATGMTRVVNSLLGWVRNSEDTLAYNDSVARKAATYAKSNIEAWAHDLNKPLEQIASKYPFLRNITDLQGGKVKHSTVRQQFERTLDASRRLSDPATGEAGYFFKNPGELQDFYNRNFNRNPSVLETEAYFNYVKVKEGERMFSELAEFRNRAKEGYEQHQLSFVDDSGVKINSGFFDARDVRGSKFPGGDDFMLIMGEKKGGEDLKKLGTIDTKRLDTMKDMWKRGEAKVLELYDIDHHPLNGFSDVAGENRVRYVFSTNSESKPLQFNHVNKRGGAHFEWDYDHYIKQADVRPQRVSGNTVENIYVGDKTVMPIKSRAVGKGVTKIWNEAHDFIKRGDWDGARPLVAKLGIDWNEFTGWYKPGRDALGNPVRPFLDANEPLMVVSKGKNIHNIDNALRERYINFKDGTKTGSLNNFKVAYNTERRSDGDLRTINDIGAKDNPIYAHQPANFVDPITTMTRSLNRSINSLFMDDYKLYGVEHWLREAEPFLEAKGGVNEIRSSPFAHFVNPQFKSDIDYTLKQNLLSNRYKIQSFIGIPSKFDAWVHSFTEHLADAAYERYGPETGRTAFQKARTITPIWLMHSLKNPVDFIRSATFNFKLGLFNPAQFLVQAQTHSLIWALEPKHGTVGTYGMLLHGWSRVNKNPAIIDALDNYYTKLNMFGSKARPGEFKEAMEALERSGFENVAGEYANLSKAYLPTTNFVNNDINKGLRLGQTPFRLGEQSTRVTAWYTAFRKFREANPTARLDNLTLGKITQEADKMTVNMSRASSSMLNHGVFSLSTQFLSYQIKLAELFWSKRIGETATERAMARARLITGFAMLYGLPNAVGVTGAPVSDNIQSHFMDDLGYIPGDKWLSTMINEGFPSWSLAMITGKGDLQKGLVANVGDRFGSQGWSNIKQGLRSDIPWWQAIGGAGVSTMSKFMGDAADPFWQGALSWARGDTKDARFTIRAADLLEPLKQISTYSAGAKWRTAINTGKWISNNEQFVTDISPLRASILALTGMSPQEQDRAFLRGQITQGETDAQKVALKDAIKDWRRGIEARNNKDPEQGDAYMRNAMARLTAVGYPYDKILSFMAIANKGWESTIDRADWNSWSRGDRNKQQKRLEQYQRQYQLDQNRNQ